MSRPRVAVSLPEPGLYGWGVCATELTAALREQASVVDPPGQGDLPFEYAVPLLHAIQGVNLLPLRPNVWSTGIQVGYCFIEENLRVRRYALNASRYYDRIVTGSTWCTEALERAGLWPVTTAIQGVSERFLSVSVYPDRPDDGRFIIFSGGKAETRKGQDIVIQAVKIMMDRHDDVYLSCAWFNPWESQIEGYSAIIGRLADLIPEERLLGPVINSLDHSKVAQLYANSDVGLFPNRCEAGTNLVMMEYMACGKPVVATFETGHRDVLSAGSPLALINNRPIVRRDETNAPVAIWYEPDLDEVVAKLELAYVLHQAGSLAEGNSNRERMRLCTWKRCAGEILEALLA